MYSASGRCASVICLTSCLLAEKRAILPSSGCSCKLLLTTCCCRASAVLATLSLATGASNDLLPSCCCCPSRAWRDVAIRFGQFRPWSIILRRLAVRMH